MSSWTSAEKATLRSYLGYPALFHTFEPRLENAISAVQSTADGGALPDSSTQDRMRLEMAAVAAVETKLDALQCSFSVLEAGTDKVRLDAIRASVYLKAEGRRHIARISDALGTQPITDYFTGAPIGPMDNVFQGRRP